MTEKRCNMKPARNSVNFPVINIYCRLVCTFNRDVDIKDTEMLFDIKTETKRLFKAWDMEILSVAVNDYAFIIEFRTDLSHDTKHCVNSFKTITSRKIRTKYKDKMGSMHLWDSGYYLCSLEDADTISINEYVKSQHRIKRKYGSATKTSQQ